MFKKPTSVETEVVYKELFFSFTSDEAENGWTKVKIPSGNSTLSEILDKFELAPTYFRALG
jgi:hypothetical protein